MPKKTTKATPKKKGETLKKRISMGVTLKMGTDPKSYEFIRVDVANEADTLPGETSDDLLKRIGKLTYEDLLKCIGKMGHGTPELKKAYDEMLP